MSLLKKCALELQELANKKGLNGDGLTAKEVIAFAKSRPRSAVREWLTKRGGFDPAKAAALGLLVLTRRLMRKVTLVYEQLPYTNEPTRVRVLHSLDTDREDGGGYRETMQVLTDTSLRAALLRTAVREYQALRNRYKTLAELASVHRAIDDLPNP